MEFKPEKISRRRFLKSAVAAGSLGALSIPSASGQHSTQSVLPTPEESGIDHVVLVMMENRSFDHFLGWMPGANGRQAGLRYPDFTGQLQPTHHLTDFQGCAFQDPDHSYEGGRIEYDNGRCDGWLQANDMYSIGYYEQSDLAFLGAAAPSWTVCDNYFAAILAETYPNRFYQHAAQTDRIHNVNSPSTLPTIWDRLQTAGLTGKYYFNDAPFTALWGTKYLGISVRILSSWRTAPGAVSRGSVLLIRGSRMRPAAPRMTIIRTRTSGTANTSSTRSMTPSPAVRNGRIPF